MKINKLILLYIFTGALISCIIRDNVIVEYYSTGEIYRKYSVNNKQELDGEYIEYYKNGKLKISTSMKDGGFLDSLSYFNDRGILIAKGIMKKNELRIGWWRELDSISDELVFRDYSIVNDKNYISQEIYLNKNSDTIFSKSRFFKLDFKNELKQGDNLARLRYYDGISTNESDLSLILNSSTNRKNDTLVFNEKSICYFHYTFKPNDSQLKARISESTYFKNNSVDESIFQVKNFDIVFDLEQGKTIFFGNSFYDETPIKRVFQNPSLGLM